MALDVSGTVIARLDDADTAASQTSSDEEDAEEADEASLAAGPLAIAVNVDENTDSPEANA